MTSALQLRKPVWVLMGLMVGVLAGAPALFAAETDDSSGTHTTYVMFKVDSTAPINVQTTFRQRPAVLSIQFPSRQVLASIPERTTVMKGIIQTITARYSAAPAEKTGRFLDSIQIAVSAPYPYRVRSEPGRIIVAIDHPLSVKTASVEVGLRGGTIIGGASPRTVTERFRAMQDALARATPAAWTAQPAASAPSASAVMAERATPSSEVLPSPMSAGPSSEQPVIPSARREAPSPWLWVVVALLIAATAAAAGWHIVQAGGWRAWQMRRAASGMPVRMPSGVILIDQLVWRAFERQGYQLVVETELTQPPFGTLRVIAKEGAKRAMLFVGHGPFFEKQTVERFLKAMREVGVEEGLLIAAGSFTVPAQRIAKEHQITLIGREQLTELLSAGAGSEYYARQLEQQQERLEEAKGTLQQFAGELDTLRRQRNEASWYLGEERARSAKMETQLEEFHQQLRRYETDLQRWQQEATALRKQWEENEWYLGESRERVRHLESQLAASQPMIQRVDSAERSQAEAEQRAEADRAQRAELEARFAAMHEELQETLAREQRLQATVASLERELGVFHAHGERRRQARVATPDATVELRNGKAGLVWSGTLRDLSRNGLGIECAEELPALPWFRARIQIPGRDAVESKMQVRWQQPGGEPARYRSGCKFVSVSRSTRALLDELMANTG